MLPATARRLHEEIADWSIGRYLIKLVITWTEGLRVMGMTSRLASSHVTCSVSSSQRHNAGQKAPTRPAAASKTTTAKTPQSLISLVLLTEAGV